MIVTQEDCDHALRRLDAPAAETGGASETVLSAIRVIDGDGTFRLTAPLPPSQRREVTVDLAPGALRVRSGPVSRWVPLPPDALVDQAVVQTSEEALTVSMPVRERRAKRHLIYVW
ncbi:hypothetical protein [Nitrospira moscoviensis]|uniref:ArsA HSP20-like domain-containing protein n=1 Tax=Nitrospira moscoviensis TaxID=42253 RepID=A0A0K2GDF2_NITMO|nr:hypothetical protein [Nitrospira moscoviensis]ALA58973.1 hypothetical protein NITMOv2_2560 [Nitrospira moscoviensis]